MQVKIACNPACKNQYRKLFHIIKIHGALFLQIFLAFTFNFLYK